MAIDGVPKKLALKLANEANIDTFIETGTYKGNTARWAAGNFDYVTTIEAYKPRYQKTKAGLKDRYPSIKFCLGDSRTRLLSERQRAKRESVMLWLDAHWCGNYEKSQGTDGECPLIDELKHVGINDIVMIDDARLFVNPPPRPHDPGQWPTYQEIKNMLPGRYIRIVGDVIVAVPRRYAYVVRQYCNEYDKTNEDIQTVFATSNLYVHCLPPAIYLWNKYIGKTPITVARYDKRPPALPGNASQIAIGKQSDFSFTTGLARFVQLWHEDLILLMLEDYWLTFADVSALSYCWETMLEHPEIKKIDLSGDRMKVPYQQFTRFGINGAVVESKQDAPFRASLQAAIWRSDYLGECLGKGSWDAWTFEKHGAQNDGALILGVKLPVLEYVNAVGGQGNKPGELDYKKIPARLFNEIGFML